MIKRSLISYAVLVFLFFVMATMSWYLIDRMIVARTNQTRLDQITNIYTSFALGDPYRIARSDVFGDKRVYGWDAGRTYSSVMEYGHNDTPQNTITDLKKKIEAAGFKQFDTVYAESANPQYHFKNDQGQYVRVTVTSRYVQDAIIYGIYDNGDPLVNHKDEAPTYVTIKVNLDDNNE